MNTTRPNWEFDDALGAGQAAEFRETKDEGVFKLVDFYLKNGLCLHLEQVPIAYRQWADAACAEGYLLRVVMGRTYVVTVAGHDFWEQYQGDKINGK